MKILFVTPFFPPEIGAAQIRTHEFASRLVGMGHDVHVLTTFPSYPSGVVPKEWRGHLFWNGEDNGIHVHRVWSYPAPNTSILGRIIGNLSFVFFACLTALWLPSTNVLLVESHPMFNGVAALFISFIKRAPYALNVSDLWPESAVQMGMLRNRLLVGALKKMVRYFYRHAAVVLAMTAGIREKIVAKGIDSSKVVLFRNSVDADFFCTGIEPNGLRKHLGVAGDAYVALYAGNLGLAQGLDSLLEVARLFQQDGLGKVHFVLAGDGADRVRLMQLAKDMQLKNVVFAAPLPKKSMPALLNTADCVVVPLRDLELFRGALPTKMFEAMACGKPVVLAIPGEAEDLMNEAGAGLCVRPGDFQGIHDAILRLVNDAEAARSMGVRGRTYVQSHFSRAARAAELEVHLQQAARRDLETQAT